jgi:hypothetical protein
MAAFGHQEMKDIKINNNLERKEITKAATVHQP